MTGSALVITYHAVEPGTSPLALAPEALGEHLDCLRDAGVRTLTISELAGAVRAGAIPERAVALTFDDAFASVVEHAAPLLADRGQRATVFPVAGAIGATNDWPSQPPGAPRAPLADLEQLRALAAAGWEIGSHGTEHAPLSRVTAAQAHSELVESRERLEQALQVPVTSFAMPYGDLPGASTRELLRATYDTACTTRLAFVTPGTDAWAVPRVDAYYLRRPELLRRAVEGTAGLYVRVRGAAARARRVVRKDYVVPGR